ncbi:unannotated protein [freshwater metagenome]|uniref:Unannotated protein n=1 Tax=freshwater metagenome TaxID=449393 RepID=A0A6J6HZ08_9ZZZZ|nr:hypothetical protein [Actinomycetota bacterium]
MNLERISTLGPDWAATIDVIASMLAWSEDFVTMNVFTADGDFVTYVQTLLLENGSFLIEASGETNPPGIINASALQTLRDLGWQPPTGDDFPNFFIVLPTWEIHEIAAFLILTLRDVYHITHDHKYSCVPEEVFHQVVRWKVGNIL